MLNCGKLAAPVCFKGFRGSGVTALAMHRFYNKIEDLCVLAEVPQNWQEEKPPILLKSGGSDPQFFPQTAGSVFMN
jgi:hypothetical protein